MSTQAMQNAMKQIEFNSSIAFLVNSLAGTTVMFDKQHVADATELPGGNNISTGAYHNANMHFDMNNSVSVLNK